MDWTLHSYRITASLMTLLLLLTATPSSAADTTPPTVISTSPVNGASDISTNTTITATFSEAIRARSVSLSDIVITPAVGGSIAVSGSTLVFTPATALVPTTLYHVKLRRGIRDRAGNRMDAPYSFSFTTAASSVTPTPTGDCSATDVLCVDDTAGSTQEYATIQAAVTAAQPGQTVLVYDGTYSGFRVAKSGRADAPIIIRAQGNNAIIDNRNSSTGDGIRLDNASYITIEGFDIRGKNSAGTQTITERCIAARGATPTSPMRGDVIRNNRCTSSGLEGFYLSEINGGVIENNTITGTGGAGGTRNHGIYLANAGADDTVIRGNTITTGANAGSESNGIHLNGDLSVGGDGLITGVVIESNTIYNNGQNGINMDGVRDSVVRNNLVYGNARNALRAYAIDGAAGPANLQIVNNTLIASTSGWAAKLSEDDGGHTIFNNIFQGVSGSLSVGNIHLVSDYNATDNRFSADNDTTTISLTSWQSRTGQDTHSIVTNADSLFAAGSYQLSSNSPARDRGISSLNGIAAPPTDIIGITRPQGPGVDIGAYEAQ